MKRFIFSIIALCAVVGCMKDEVDVISEGEKEIKISKISDKATRATEGDESEGDEVVSDPFTYSVYAESSLAQSDWFIKGESLKDDVMDSGTVYYWPSSGTLSFYALSPASTSSVVTSGFSNTTDRLLVTHTTPADASDDFCVARTLTQSSSTNDGEVTLTFQHKLTKVNISSLSVSSLAAGYELDYAGATYSMSVTYSSGTVDIAADASFTPAVGSATYSNTTGEFMIVPHLSTKDVVIKVSGVKIKHSATGVVVYNGDVSYTFTGSETNGSSFAASSIYDLSLSFSTTLSAVTLNVASVSEWGTAEIVYITQKGDYQASIRSANCYMIHPKDNNTTYYIPIDVRINDFWANYSSLTIDELGYYVIDKSNADDLGIEVVWTGIAALNAIGDPDSDDFKACIDFEIVTSGFDNTDDDVSPRRDAADRYDFCSMYTNVALKVTINPAAFASTGANTSGGGNLVVAITKNVYELDADGAIDTSEEVKKVLWSWHLWITDYDPDTIVANSTPAYGQFSDYTYTDIDGKVQRYCDPDTSAQIWNGGLYNDSFVMDRNLGAIKDNYTESTSSSTNLRGFLYYQFGRKDPFPYSGTSGDGGGHAYVSYYNNYGTTSEDPGIVYNRVGGQVSFDESVQHPGTFYYNTLSTNTTWCTESTAGITSYLWYDKNVKRTLATIDGRTKSIFDPSPLGWQVPTYTIWQNFSDDNITKSVGSVTFKDDAYEGTVTFPTAGYITKEAGEHQGYTNVRLWSTAQDGTSTGYAFYAPGADSDSPNINGDTSVDIEQGNITAGRPVRCVTAD